MNVVDCYVTKILGEPYLERGWWVLGVGYNCYGREFETEIFKRTKEEIDDIKIGYHFLS